MQVFTSNTHHLHAPRWYVADGTVRPCPDDPARVDRVLSTLSQAGHPVALIEPPSETLAPSIENRKSEIENPSPDPPDPLPALRGIHSPDYLHYLRTIHFLWSAEFPNTDVLPDTFPRFRPAHAGHPQRPLKPAAQPGYYCFDMAAPITSGTYAAALAASTCAVAAANTLLHGARAAYALCRPPGHHAGPDYCGGFCYLNHAAAAAQHLLLQGMSRIALLDIDYHHGNGTQDIFYARSDVLYVSIHADPNTQYPYFWGHASETGAGAGAGFTHNFPLPRGTDESTWLATLTRALHVLNDYRPQALILSLGVDTYEHDTVGDFHLSLAGLHQAAQQIASLHLPTAIIQEGGYNLDAVGPCVAEFLREFN